MGVVSSDGTFEFLAISPGWGASAYYAPEVLRREASKLIPRDLQMFANHQTAQEAKDRPEGNIQDLMAVVIEPGTYKEHGFNGPGVYGRAKALSHYRDFIDEAGPHIGLSIRASGNVETGEAEGRRGPVLQSFVAPRSLDFVTQAGRGGQVRPLAEAGGHLQELFEAARSAAHLAPASPPASTQGGSAVDEQETQRLQESVNALREANEAQARQLQESNARMAELAEALVKRDIDRVLVESLATAQIHPMVRERLTRDLKLVAPVEDGALNEAKFGQMIADRLKGELAYISETSGVAPGRITGLGPSVREEASAAEAEKALAEAFAGLGLSAEAAGIAAAGRR